MRPTHASLFVQDEQCRPRFDPISFPCRIVIVGYDRIFDAERRHFATNIINVLFALKFWRMHPDDRQSPLAIARVPTLDRRQSVAAVIATKRPEIDYDHTAT